MRVNSPPSVAWRASSAASVFTVTALSHETRPARPQRAGGGIEHGGVAGAATDKDGVRRRQADERVGRRGLDNLQSRHAERGGVAADAGRAVFAPLYGDGAHRRIRQHPFDRDRAGARADVPEQFAVARRQRRHRQRPDFAFGDLAVVVEQGVGKSGGARQHACIRRGVHIDREDVEGIGVAKIERCGMAAANPFARTAKCFEDGQARAAEARFSKKLCQRTWAVAIGCQRQNPRARLQMRPHQIERTAVHRKQHGVRQRPAESGRRRG